MSAFVDAAKAAQSNQATGSRLPQPVEAANELSTETHTLSRSLSGLDAACQGTVLIRASPRSPHHLTALGRRLADQAAQWERPNVTGTSQEI